MASSTLTRLPRLSLSNYAITAYGSDPPVDGIVKRMKEGDIVVPMFSLGANDNDESVRFQREYVWKKQQADRFVESLLLGLPVPGIFLVKEDTGRTSFWTVTNVSRRSCGPTTTTGRAGRSLSKVFRIASGVRCTRILSLLIDGGWTTRSFTPRSCARIQPSEDLSSIDLIFERLNSGGTSLQPQEIPSRAYHGQFVELLTALNSTRSWRVLFGRKSRRLKDIELILRFFALLESSTVPRGR